MGFLEHVDIQIDGSAARATVATSDASTNENGGVHGGLIATLIDATMARAVADGLGEDRNAVTVQLAVTYLNGAEPGDELVAEAQVKKQTKTLALVESDVTRVGDGEAIAHGVATFAVTSKD